MYAEGTRKSAESLFHVISELIVYGAGKPKGFPAWDFLAKSVIFHVNNKISFDIRVLLCILGGTPPPRGNMVKNQTALDPLR